MLSYQHCAAVLKQTSFLNQDIECLNIILLIDNEKCSETFDMCEEVSGINMNMLFFPRMTTSKMGTRTQRLMKVSQRKVDFT